MAIRGRLGRDRAGAEQRQQLIDEIQQPSQVRLERFVKGLARPGVNQDCCIVDENVHREDPGLGRATCLFD